MLRIASPALAGLLCAAGGGALVLVTPPAHAREFYVDPVVGSMTNDGSQARPWRTLQEVLDGGLVETQNWSSLPYGPNIGLVPSNPGAPVQAGDTIWLRTGAHGALRIEGAYNALPITVSAELGHTPRFERARVRAAANWVLRGLSISPEHGPSFDPGPVVVVESHAHMGPSHDIVVEDCEVFSVRDTSQWGIREWNDLASNGVEVRADRVTIRNNRVLNVDFGISVSGDESLIEHNTVENFAGDGLRGLGDYLVFQYNVVKNCYDVNDNHDDGFQSWSVGPGGVGTGEVAGMVLRGNTIINYEDPNQPFRGPLQGIGCFDGLYVDWVVENNVIITDHWHGITLLGARDSRIVNNTVIDINSVEPGPPWVRIGKHKDGRASEGCVVRNNLSTGVRIDVGQSVDASHNLVAGNLGAHFVDQVAFDLRLVATSSAIDSGLSDLAPSLDRDQVPRPQGAGVDIGAFEYRPDPPELDAGSVADAVTRDAAASDVEGSGADGGSDRADTAQGSDATEPDGGPGPVPSGERLDLETGCGCRTSVPSADMALVVLVFAFVCRRRARP